MPQRNAGFDIIRILLTSLVVLHHIAISYGGSGGWYWRQEADSSNVWLVAFNTINQSFFMGFFFLLAGYYSAGSIHNKGNAIFLKDRFIRLGLPLLVFFFVLQPFTIALVRAENWSAVGLEFLRSWRELDFGPGPLWFAEALLIFSVVLALLRKLLPNKEIRYRQLPTFLVMFFVVLGLGLINFAVRTVVPVGENILWLQIGYFPCYIFLFFAGVASGQERLLEHLSARQVVPWIIIVVVCLLILRLAFAGTFGTGSFAGGLNMNALFYALWDPLMGFSIIFILLWLSQRLFSWPSLIGDFLARRAFVVFIIHPPIVVALSLMMMTVAISPVAKFFLVGGLSLTGCVIVGSLLLLIPPIRKIV